MRSIVLRIFFCLYVLAAFCSAAVANETAQSLIDRLDSFEGNARTEALIDIAFQLHRRDVDKAFDYANQAVISAKKSDTPSLLGRAYLQRARASSALERFDAMADDIQSGLIIADELETDGLECQLRVLSVLAAKQQSRLQQGLRDAERALDACERAGDAKYYKIAFYNAATIHYETGDTATASAMSNRLLETQGDLADIGDPAWIPRDAAWAATLLANIHTADGEFDRAVAALETALASFDATDDPNTYTTLNYSLANSLVEAGHYDDALPILRETLSDFETSKNITGLIATNAQLGRTYAALGQADLAVFHTDQAVEIAGASQQSSGRLAREARKARIQVLAQIGRETDALDQSAALVEDIETAFSTERAVAVAKAQSEVDALAREREIERLRMGSEIDALTLSRQRRNLSWSAAMAMLLMGFAALLAWRIRQERSLNSRLKVLVEQRDALVREVNHRVKNNLQVVAGLLQLEREALPSGEAHRIGADALRDMEIRIGAMAGLHRRLNARSAGDATDMDAFLKDLGHDSRILYKDVLDVTVEAFPFLLPLQRAVPVGLILCELIANAAKHAMPGSTRMAKIHIAATPLDPDGLAIHIRDNGPGASLPSTQQDETSTGLALIHSLADQADAEIACIDDGGAGMQWCITLRP